MSISITDIAKELTWINNNVYLKTDKPEHLLLIDYLNDTNDEFLNRDLERLEKFKAITDTKNKEKIEEYLLGHYGFNQYNDGNIYAYLAGATDLGFGVLYNLENDNIVIKHIYSEPNEKYIIQLSDLINVLRQKKAITNAIA